MIKISLQNVDVSLPVFGPNGLSLRAKLVNFVSRNSSAAGTGVEVFHAIRDMSIELKEGDRIGLRGPNGAGKSTFLRLVGGIYQPTGGKITVSGTRRCLFSLASGMEMEATGWEYIRIGGRRIGVPKSELEALCDDVAEFSELGKSLDRPIRTYSQGMLLRLSFGVVTSKPADIILIDEVIGVGDTKFMEKANQRMMNFADQAKILLLASHSNEVIEMFCNQILTFEQGKIAKRIMWNGPLVANTTNELNNPSITSSINTPIEKPAVKRTENSYNTSTFCETFGQAIAQIRNSGDAPELTKLKNQIVEMPYSPELHDKIGDFYEEFEDYASAFMQYRNAFALGSNRHTYDTLVARRRSLADTIPKSYTMGYIGRCYGTEMNSMSIKDQHLVVDLLSEFREHTLELTHLRYLIFSHELNGIQIPEESPSLDPVCLVSSFGTAITGVVSDGRRILKFAKDSSAGSVLFSHRAVESTNLWEAELNFIAKNFGVEWAKSLLKAPISLAPREFLEKLERTEKLQFSYNKYGVLSRETSREYLEILLKESGRFDTSSLHAFWKNIDQSSDNMPNESPYIEFASADIGRITHGSPLKSVD